MSTACITDGINEKCVEFWPGNLRRRDDLENLGVDGRILLKLILKKGGLADVSLSQDMDQWRAVMNTAMDVRIP
jgi:hypothetical protein